MRHLKEVTVGKPPRVAPADILGTRALIILLTEFVGLLSGVQQLLKGIPVEGDGGDEGDGDGHDDEH